MVDLLEATQSAEGKAALRRHLHKALNSNRSYTGVASTLNAWHQKGWGPVLFGGFLRDLMIFGFKRWPRDIDIVIRNRSIDQLKQELRAVHPKQNRFGGFHCELNRWECDVWPLYSTWAFHNIQSLKPNIENLPKTTFLNVEAVAAEIGEDGSVGEIYDSGFFEALRLKILDINLEENPFPSLAAVRTLVTAKKLNFSMSIRLSNYIVETVHRNGIGSLVDAQLTHYGLVKLRQHDLESLLKEIRSKLDMPCEAVHLDAIEAKQLRLWNVMSGPSTP